ncbi:MAG: hypothetical protein M1828_007024 [Chrysothrix sp. TS-e1954]|nr:MAG: hypothetical protein M1828_007024 [Chrysothrix sp. TS-e1954]
MSASPWLVPLESSWFSYRGQLYSIKRKRAANGPYEARQEYLSVKAFNKAAISDLLTQASELHRDLKPDAIEVCVPLSRKERNAQSCPWSPPKSGPSRLPSTLELSAEAKMVLEDIGEFLKPETRKRYKELGLPYKRNLLFDGLPGTGKSSVASVLAALYHLRLYKINPSDVNLADEDLPRLMAATASNSIVLLDDLDRASLKNITTLDDSPRAGGISLTGLMDLLDSTIADGRIIIATCNERTMLQDVLTRPGRIDREISFPLISVENAKRMFRRFYVADLDSMDSDALVHKLGQQLVDGQVSPAMLERHFIRSSGPLEAIQHLGDMEGDVVPDRSTPRSMCTVQ